MANPNRRGQAGSPVSTGSIGSSTTPWANTSWILPHGLQLQQKVGQAVITNVSASAGTVTYTAANDYSAGNVVSIYDISPNAYNLQRVTIASATSTQFTVTNAATGTFVSGGVAQRTGVVPVTIPAGVTWVYVILAGAGGGAGGTGVGSGGPGAGGVAWGWTLASSVCVIGGSGSVVNEPGGYSRYGHIAAGGGAATQGNNGSAAAFGLGGAGCGSSSNAGGGGGGAGTTNFYGMPGGATTAAGADGIIGAGGSGGGNRGNKGGDGISGGGGGAGFTGSGGNGGSGLAGGSGGGYASGVCGNGGTGINVLTGAITTGTSGTSSQVGTGGGILGNASANRGGLGGGGGGTVVSGGAGVVLLFY